MLPHAAGARVLLLRASRGREVLAEMLTAAGATVSQAVVYDSRDVLTPDAEVAQALREGRIDWVTVTSSAIAKSLIEMFGDDLKRARLAAISPLTAGVLEHSGLKPAAVAESYTTAGVVQAILAVQSQGSREP
jgi:uroporphyrinogen III methyltransferase/synthase